MMENLNANLRESRLRQSIYEDARAFNELASAALELSEPHLAGSGLFSVLRSTRDVDQNKRRRYLYHVALNNNNNRNNNVALASIPPVELQDGIMARIPSPSGEKVAIFREEEHKKEAPSNGSSSSNNNNKGKKQQVLELWVGHSLQRRIPLPDKEHGKCVFDAATFGGPSWNVDETVLVYVAERNPPTSSSFFEDVYLAGSNGGMHNNNDEEEADLDMVDSDHNHDMGRGAANTLGYGKSEGWGEKYPRQAPLLDFFLVNTDTGRVGKVTNCPGSETGQRTTLGSFALGQPVFEPTKGQAIVYTAWDAGGGADMPRRLGLIYCQQRPSKLYASPVEKLLERLGQTTTTTTTTTAQRQASGGNESPTSNVTTTTTRDDSEAAPSSNDENTPTTERDDGEEEKDGACYCLTLESRLARSPLFSPVSNGTSKLVYLASKDGFDTHSGCFQLNGMDWKNGRPVNSSHCTLVKSVWNPSNDSLKESGMVLGMKFPGLFLNQLPKYGFVSSNQLLLTTQWGSSSRIVRVSLENGALVTVQHASDENDSSSEKECDTLLCAHNDLGVIGMTTAPNKVGSVWHVPSRVFQNEGEIVIQPEDVAELDSISAPIVASKYSPALPFTPQLSFRSDMFILQDKDQPRVKGVQIQGVPLQTILLTPGSTNDHLPPLIVVPHGGPHGASVTTFAPSLAYLVTHGGYAVALVNYRGSTGFGQEFVEILPSRIGDLDVKDIVAVTLKLKESGLVDKNRVGICGGSHGGFLTAHCTGQYPDLFKCAVMRNPVTNLPSMTTSTDIPDWVFVEGLGRYDWMKYRPALSKEEVCILWSKSPIAYVENVKTPTLIALGMQDLRVPPSQGLEWYHTLRSKRTPTKLLIYDDNDHAILGSAAEADHWVNIKRWFDEHL